MNRKAEMSAKRAFITGITGQDGALLAELLLEKGYEVHGVKRRSSSFNTERVNHLYQDPHEEDVKFFMHYGDLTDATNMIRLVQECQPTEIYNLAAQSHVQVSFETPEYTAQADGLGTLRLLEAIRILGLEKKTRFYQASTSELYGMVAEVPQTEHTPFRPRSPYASAKLYAFWTTPPNDPTNAACNGYTHGTNTSQCAVGNRSDFDLDENLDGVARGARLVFQDVGLPGSCNLQVPNPMFGMYDEVRANGGHLINGSFVTCAYGSYGSSAFDLDQYGWDNKDFLAFFSGGNGGGGNACPGTNKNHISSGGHYQFPFENEFFGSFGPSPNGRIGPTVLAPACDHFGGNPPPFDFRTSTSIQSNDNNITGPPSGDEEIVEGVCGTSFSSPYLLGVAALIRDYFEKGVWPTGLINPDDAFAPSAALVKATLINSGDFVENCIGCVFSGITGSMGMGRVNLSSTLALAGNPQTPPGTRIVDRGMAIGLKTGEVYEEWIEVLDPSVPLKIALVWVDRPGSTLTNDLRLIVIGPDDISEQRYIGNNFGTGAYSLSVADGGVTSDTNNVLEAVRINPAELVAGIWRVRIVGGNVPMGDPLFDDSQPFVLIASGGIDGLGIAEVSAIGAGPLLAVSRTTTEVTWEWETLADPSIDYSFYRGTLASVRLGIYDHGMVDASQCGISGGTTTAADAANGEDSYYLVSGHKNGNDGPLGEDRPDADPQCP